MTVLSFLRLLAGWLFYGVLIGVAGGIFVVTLYAVLRAARSLWERHRA